MLRFADKCFYRKRKDC